MKNIFLWCLMLLVFTTACAQHDDVKSNGSATTGKGPESEIRIQGVPKHILHGEKPARATRGIGDDISFDDINYWVGSGNNKAALIIKFNDGIADNAMVWGYKFSADSVSSEQMLRDIAKADTRMEILLQYQGYSYGYYLGWGLGGIGFNHAANGKRFPLEVNLADAIADSQIKFNYSGQPNTEYGQKKVPTNVALQLEDAIYDQYQSGVIEHPFEYNEYGFPAYDFDYWDISGDDSNKSWRSGWYKGYWSFYIKEVGDTEYDTASTGITSHYVKDGYKDGYFFCDDPSAWPCGNMDGPYTYVTAP